MGFQDSILLEAVKFIYLGTRFNMKVGKGKKYVVGLALSIKCSRGSVLLHG